MTEVLPFASLGLPFAAAQEFITRAFETAEHCDGTEAALTAHLRSSPLRALPGLEFAASEEGRLTGYVLLSRTDVRLPDASSLPAVLLAPLCVEASARGQGLGTRLAKAALQAAAAQGETLALVLGAPAYYGRFGFAPFESAGLRIRGADDALQAQMAPYAQWKALAGDRENLARLLAGGAADLLVEEVFPH